MTDIDALWQEAEESAEAMMESLQEEEKDGEGTAPENPAPEQDDEDAPNEEKEHPEGAEEPEGSAPDSEPEPTDPADFLTVKFLGERRSLTKQEAESLAQKGLNYDKVLKERDELRARKAETDEIERVVKELAKASGLTVDAFLDKVQETSYTQEGTPPEVARERVLREKAERALQRHKEELQEQEAQKNEMQTRVQKDVAAFQAEYPDVKPQDIPKEVWDAVNGGKATLTAAYHAYEKRTLQKQIADLQRQEGARRQQEQNRARSTGSMGLSSGEEKKDDFLDGFYGR